MSDNPLILQYSDGNLVPYQAPDPAQAAQRALDFTGIPDLAAGANALARGEWLPGLGQAASGAAGLLPLGKLAGAAKLGAELMPLGGLIKAWHGTPHLFEPVPARAVEESGITAYHATPAGFDENFAAGTHFGTLDAAHTRLQEILNTPDELRYIWHPKTGTETPAVYRVKLKPNKVLDVPDLGEFHDSDIASHLYSKGIITGNEFGSIQNGEAEAIDVLRQKGYDALRYTNIHESPGSVSHMVLDPSIISPTHRLEPPNPFGEFRDAAIGSGEGAQAYGHGHYVAGNPSVAASYKQTGNTNFTLDNFPYHADELDTMPSEQSIGIGALLRFQGDKAGATNWLSEIIKGMKEDPHKYFGGDEPWMKEDIGNHQEALNWLQDNSHRVTVPQGSLLEVHILPDEHELLDWDKPLAAQPPGVKKVIDQIHSENEDLRIKHSGPDVTGENFYLNLANQLWDKTMAGIGGGSQAASAALHEAGIPGIKYLDQGSRRPPNLDLLKQIRDNWLTEDKEVVNRQVGSPNYYDRKMQDIEDQIKEAERWKPTSNYVIFDPKNLRIVGRNGQRLEPVEEDPFK